MRRTKIIATIGPKTESLEMLQKLAENGMNIARINMSHGSHEWHSTIIEKIKKINEKNAFPIGIMVDTQGPVIRTSAHTEYGLEEGDTFKIAVSSACDIQEGEKHTFVDYENLIKKVSEKDIILIDDGLIALEVMKVEPYHITCKVLNKGNLGKRKTITIPGIKTGLPSITKKDIEDVKFAVKQGIDYVAQSFVTKKEDIRQMRELLNSLGSNAMIIAKIEDQEGVDNMDEIINEADGVMVARGDLGVQIQFEEIPIIQKQIVKKCIEAGKPVIIATHLLESMINNPRPTRAEVSDVSNAVFEKADCIMLSGETTKGLYPAECVRAMHNIAKNVQSRLKFDAPNGIKTNDVKEAITLGACINAENLDAKAIIVFSRTGKLLSLVTKKRPNIDIFVFTDNENVKKKLIMHWGAFPFAIEFNDDFEAMANNAINILRDKKLLDNEDRVIIVSDVNQRKNVDILEIRKIL
ncbi:pyruvate kinase [Candidatus Woesearchaeota archaeon]|nr:pyruvate kinase [Candidatus Woesearchaeota archaeon]